MRVKVIATPAMCCGVLAVGYEGEAEIIPMKDVESFVTNKPFEDDIVIVDGTFLCWSSEVVKIEEMH